jgi:hypothetical protein
MLLSLLLCGTVMLVASSRASAVHEGGKRAAVITLASLTATTPGPAAGMADAAVARDKSDEVGDYMPHWLGVMSTDFGSWYEKLLGNRSITFGFLTYGQNTYMSPRPQGAYGGWRVGLLNGATLGWAARKTNSPWCYKAGVGVYLIQGYGVLAWPELSASIGWR